MSSINVNWFDAPDEEYVPPTRQFIPPSSKPIPIPTRTLMYIINNTSNINCVDEEHSIWNS